MILAISLDYFELSFEIELNQMSYKLIYKAIYYEKTCEKVTHRSV